MFSYTSLVGLFSIMGLPHSLYHQIRCSEVQKGKEGGIEDFYFSKIIVEARSREQEENSGKTQIE